MINRLHSDRVYLGDNGAMTCGEHAGSTARATGRDLHGARMEEVDAGAIRLFASMGITAACETCGLEARLVVEAS